MTAHYQNLQSMRHVVLSKLRKQATYRNFEAAMTRLPGSHHTIPSHCQIISPAYSDATTPSQMVMLAHYLFTSSHPACTAQTTNCQLHTCKGRGQRCTQAIFACMQDSITIKAPTSQSIEPCISHHHHCAVPCGARKPVSMTASCHRSNGSSLGRGCGGNSSRPLPITLVFYLFANMMCEHGI